MVMRFGFGLSWILKSGFWGLQELTQRLQRGYGIIALGAQCYTFILFDSEQHEFDRTFGIGFCFATPEHHVAYKGFRKFGEPRGRPCMKAFVHLYDDDLFQHFALACGDHI